jgi:hypothetical protein
LEEYAVSWNSHTGLDQNYVSYD